ncbi:MAG: RNA 2',3'-cyclic phosphodiesterase [Alphaproteobacteria bacterium]
MIRLFVGLDLPEEVRAKLARLQTGVPGAKWAKPEQLHLTLRFIGEVDGVTANGIDDALLTIRGEPFALELAGVGEFGGRNPRALWAGVRPSEHLIHLQKKTESALQRLGLEAETRKFTPHVLLARLKISPRGRVMDFLTDHALFASGPFEVGRFILFSSQLGSNGAVYRPERVYALAH